MNNEHLKTRLAGILTLLKGVYEATQAVPNETKGGEREAFIDGFLYALLPPTTRIGNGSVTDKYGNMSGQLDIVLEYPILPSVPLRPDLRSRLYLAEGVAAALEVKSDLSKQWDQVVATADKLAKIRRVFGKTASVRNRHPFERIPLIVVGYRGWKESKTVKEKVEGTHGVDGVLDIDLGFFYANIPHVAVNGSRRSNEALRYSAIDVDGLWGLACVLNEQVNNLADMGALASDYTFQNGPPDKSASSLSGSS